ncbi:hypothetical protein CHS0354_003225 [Potamilus streckersoni]|uniref:Uncharacterized protein n=1 Tax=Potamilus streckersoni TaxID=2493646 RepID=A0AAE0VW31_9BIVA|nr:hypothetical protein CHS0354_003225 [Potamilus streckersoni]
MDSVKSLMEQGRRWMGMDSFPEPRVKTYQKMLCCVTAFLVILLLPYIHIGILHLKFWVPDKPAVDKEHCKCDCFDTVYKGSYENPGNVKYKHMYFNTTQQTFKIWLLTLSFILVFFECLKHLLSLWLHSRLRWTMFALFISDIFPHYYSWWMSFNYYNDDYYEQFYHQLFFSATELIATVFVVKLCDSNVKVTLEKVVPIVSISCIHLFVGGLDQFVAQLLLGEGTLFQKFRNLGFLFPDFIHVIIPTFELYRTSAGQPFNMCEYMVLIMLICIGVFIGKFILI